MTRRLFRAAAFITLVVIGSPIVAQGPSRAEHGEDRREQWQKVDDVFQAMGVRPGGTVADLGAGDGFFTVRLAKAVGDQGKVYAIDIGADVLRRLRSRVANEKLSQVEVIEGAVDDPRLPVGALDAVLIVNAYHEMKAFTELLPRLKASLKPDGRLVIVEPIAPSRRDKSRDEQTRNHEIAIDFVKQETTAAGFVPVDMQDPFTTRSHAGDVMWMLVVRREKGEQK
jgi:ubiquinone/menaquinone biosynthesis C-methylase UbiE